MSWRCDKEIFFDRDTHAHTHFQIKSWSALMKKKKCVWEREWKRESGGTGEGLGERSFTLKHLRKMNIKCHQYVDPAVKLIKYYSPGWTKTKTEISWGVLFLFKRRKEDILP